MRRVTRWLVSGLVVVVLVAAGLVSLGSAVARRPLAQLDGEATLPGLNGRVTVLRETHGVPQVYADQPEDLFEAQGYLAASDRFFEMDVRRHAAAGRLSELFGASQVSTDTYVRTLGFRRTAEAELALQSPSTRRYLDAYASGVNAYLRGRSPSQVSLEYSALRLQGRVAAPEEWTAVDSLAILKVFGWQLGSNLDEEAYRGQTEAAVGAERAADLFPGPLPGYEPIVTSGTVVGKAFDPRAATRRSSGAPQGTVPVPSGASGALAGAVRARATLTGLFGSGEGIGSNSWVVSGAHTASGAAMLSNDPHLDTAIPSVLAQVGLHCSTVGAACPFDVTGYSISGMPGVVIGRSPTIAWGMTTSYADVEDLYYEQLVGDTVRVGDAYEPLTVRTEELRVAGEDRPRTLTIRSSRHGPLLSDADPVTADVGRVGRPGGSYAVALAWTGSTPGRSMDALLNLDAAQDWTGFRRALSLLSVPSQNLVYADVHGNIGYQLPGAVPVRRSGDGTRPVPGWDTRFDWTGTIPFAELPYAENPPGGVIVAANQQVVGRQYPYVVGTEADTGWRSQELLERLRGSKALTADQAEALFYVDRQRFAADLVPELLKVRVDDAWVREGQQTLVGWDYRMSADSAAAAYYAVVEHDLEKLVFRDQLPPNLWPTGGDRWYAVLDTLLDQPDNPWWDDATTKDEVETRDDVLLAALTLARKEATSLMSRDTADWSWGRIHRVRLQNQTLGSSGNPALEALFNREDAPVPGGQGTVDALAYSSTGYGVVAGPAMRMLVDLGDADAGRWVNQSGASGHPFGPYYDDQAALWVTNRTWPMVTTRNAVAARTVHTLVLKPDG